MFPLILPPVCGIGGRLQGMTFAKGSISFKRVGYIDTLTEYKCREPLYFYLYAVTSTILKYGGTRG